jgi:hypothetical protein
MLLKKAKSVVFPKEYMSIFQTLQYRVLAARHFRALDTEQRLAVMRAKWTCLCTLGYAQVRIRAMLPVQIPLWRQRKRGPISRDRDSKFQGDEGMSLVVLHSSLEHSDRASSQNLFEERWLKTRLHRDSVSRREGDSSPSNQTFPKSRRRLGSVLMGH